MAAADEAAVASGTPVEVLMDRAGRAVARTAIRMMGGRYGKKVVVVCGKGNNGGDGYAAARVLLLEGVGVRCMAVVDPDELKGAARAHYEKARAAGVQVGPFDPDRLSCDLVVDAILGTGFEGTVDRSDPVGRAIEALWDLKLGEVVEEDGNETHARPPVWPIPLVLSVDIPSGIDGATGHIEGSFVVADATISMVAEKLGTFLAPTRYTGEVEIADIGIEPTSASAYVMDRSSVAAAFPPRSESANKRTSGALAILAGSDAMPGAAALVARAAMRAGCGHVSLGCTSEVAQVVKSLCPEVLVHVISEKAHLGLDAIDRFAAVLERCSAVVVGPGLGVGRDQRDLVLGLIESIRKPLLLDADALNVMESAIDAMSAADNLTMTPHPAELGRLLGYDVQKVQEDRLGAAREASERSGGVVLLKGARSVIAGAGSVWLNPTGGSELATAGTGDVLSGVAGAFLANRSNLTDMLVAAAAHVHGLSGSIAAERTGEPGIVAWDVAEALPEAMEIIRDGVA